MRSLDRGVWMGGAALLLWLSSPLLLRVVRSVASPTSDRSPSNAPSQAANDDEYPNPSQSFGGGNETSGGFDVDESGHSKGELSYGWDPPMNEMTGYFQSRGGDGGSPPCRFFFHGRMRGKHPKITVWDPSAGDTTDVMVGSLSPWQGPLTISLPREPRGCQGDRYFADPSRPARFHVSSGDWVGVRVVAARQSYFHDEPNAERRTEVYAAEGDILLVDRTDRKVPGWIHAIDRRYATRHSDEPVYPGGWLHESDLFPATPPVASR